MASYGDMFTAVLLLLLAIGFVYATHTMRSLFDKTVTDTQSTMKKSGLNYDAKRGGLDIKTDMRAPDRENYVTQTSQAMLNSSKRLAKSGAATFGLSSVNGKSKGEDAKKRK